MAKEKILLPKLGESITSATVVRWLKRVKEVVKRDEPLLEVTTDKISTEIPSPVSGVVEEIFFKENDQVQVGEVIAIIDTEVQEAKVVVEEQKNDFISPAVMNFAKENNISVDEIFKIKGSGSGGRVMKKDLEEYVKHKNIGKDEGRVERIRLSANRKLIGDILSKSCREIPHASLIDEFDVSKAMIFLNLKKEEILRDKGIKVTITSIVAWAMAKAIKKYPLLNASCDGNDILMKRQVDMGIAVNVDDELMVPVVRGCEKMDLLHIAKEIGQLALEAREKKLAADKTRGGTITITNFGISGNLMGIPIIGSDQGAIVGMGAVHKKLTMEGDKLINKDVLMISLTFDHRIIDGMYGCRFLNEMKWWINGDGEESFS